MSEDDSETTPPEPPKLDTLPNDWPGQPLTVMPGDFSRYVPQGLGLAAPLVVRPWDDMSKVLSRPNYYGFDAPETDPIRAAPSNLPSGGVVYFDDALPAENLRAVFTALGVHTIRRDFALFQYDAKDTQRERCLRQLRIVSRGALAHVFGAGEHADTVRDQALTIEQAVLAFLAQEHRRWSEPYVFSPQLSGTLGGDGDWAKEALAFGFLVENSDWAVYRVWSRPWLVTK